MKHSAQCCLRYCESQDTHTQQAKTTDALGRALTVRANVCDACMAKVLQHPVQHNYYRGGGFAFVHEMWFAEEGDL